MDFVKKWWIWLLLAMFLPGLFLFDMFATTEYRVKAADQGATVKRQMEMLHDASRTLQSKPTRKDIRKCADYIQRIREEGTATVLEWNKVSAVLKEVAGRDDPNSFKFVLNAMDSELGKELANRLATEDAQGNIQPKWITTAATYKLVDTGKSYTKGEMDAAWRKFLIKKALHRICGDTAVPLATARYAVEGDTGGTWTESMGTATLELLSDITIGEVVKATHAIDGSRKDGKQGINEEEDIVYYDTYDLSFKVVAHPAVVDALLQNLLNAPKYGILLAPRKLVVKPYTLSETREAPRSWEEVSLDAVPDTIKLYTARTYDHEPPVQAECQYTIYHFDIPEPKAEVTAP